LFFRPRRDVVTDMAWQATLSALPVLDGLNADDLGRLRGLVEELLYQKDWSAAGGLDLDDAMRTRVAAQAALLILNLGIEWYRGWVEIIVYPDEFVPRHEWTDEAGVVHVSPHPLAGEAWEKGPVILSWADAGRSGLPRSNRRSTVSRTASQRVSTRVSIPTPPRARPSSLRS
jgi:hypothetical protein